MGVGVAGDMGVCLCYGVQCNMRQMHGNSKGHTGTVQTLVRETGVVCIFLGGWWVHSQPRGLKRLAHSHGLQHSRREARV